MHGVAAAYGQAVYARGGGTERGRRGGRGAAERAAVGKGGHGGAGVGPSNAPPRILSAGDEGLATAQGGGNDARGWVYLQLDLTPTWRIAMAQTERVAKIGGCPPPCLGLCDSVVCFGRDRRLCPGAPSASTVGAPRSPPRSRPLLPAWLAAPAAVPDHTLLSHTSRAVSPLFPFRPSPSPPPARCNAAAGRPPPTRL